MQLNKAEYQLKPKDTSTQHIYVLIQYSMYVYMYICINMYMLHYKESAIQDFSIARILLPPAIPESSVH